MSILAKSINLTRVTLLLGSPHPHVNSSNMHIAVTNLMALSDLLQGCSSDTDTALTKQECYNVDDCKIVTILLHHDFTKLVGTNLLQV